MKGILNFLYDENCMKVVFMIYILLISVFSCKISVVGINDTKSEKHEYHSISDNEDDDFFKPLDLGPSLMDEVFGELGSPNR